MPTTPIVRDTETFHLALAAGALDKAMEWLWRVRAKRDLYPQYDHRWLDHRERDLFRAACNKQDWEMAKRITDASILDQSKTGRIARLEELTGLRYDQIG